MEGTNDDGDGCWEFEGEDGDGLPLALPTSTRRKFFKSFFPGDVPNWPVASFIGDCGRLIFNGKCESEISPSGPYLHFALITSISNGLFLSMISICSCRAKTSFWVSKCGDNPVSASKTHRDSFRFKHTRNSRTRSKDNLPVSFCVL